MLLIVSSDNHHWTRGQGRLSVYIINIETLDGNDPCHLLTLDVALLMSLDKNFRGYQDAIFSSYIFTFNRGPQSTGTRSRITILYRTTIFSGRPFAATDERSSAEAILACIFGWAFSAACITIMSGMRGSRWHSFDKGTRGKKFTQGNGVFEKADAMRVLVGILRSEFE